MQFSPRSRKRSSTGQNNSMIKSYGVMCASANGRWVVPPTKEVGVHDHINLDFSN